MPLEARCDGNRTEVTREKSASPIPGPRGRPGTKRQPASDLSHPQLPRASEGSLDRVACKAGANQSGNTLNGEVPSLFSVWFVRGPWFKKRKKKSRRQCDRVTSSRKARRPPPPPTRARARLTRLGLRTTPQPGSADRLPRLSTKGWSELFLDCSPQPSILKC